MNICSLLPGATETIAALGLADQLVGISHECDFPPGLSAPILVEPVFAVEGMTSEDIDRHVRTAAATAQDLYRLQADRLTEAKPDVIILQNLCEVCAVTPGQLEAAISAITPRPQLLALSPGTLEDCLHDIERIGVAVERAPEARRLAEDLRRRLDAVRRRATNGPLPRPRVACLEWLAPLYIAGHWVPDMVEAAGGVAVLSESGTKSRRTTIEELVHAAPDVVVVMPCGYTKEQAAKEWTALVKEPQWQSLSAIQAGRCHVVDARSYFSRPGPRLIDGVQQLASLLHPHLRFSGSSEGMPLPLLHPSQL